MRLLALTGLSKESLAELSKRHMRTFEFHSANNVLAFAELNVGDTVFLTDVPPADLAPGICGNISMVKSFDTRMQHVYYGSANYHEEMETMSARAQMGFVSIGKIKKVEKAGLYDPVYVEVIDMKFCEAR
ncbi:MAG TPA: DUF473 domain-containing protein [Methanocella sp.]|uniref:DUF473 domain-containing protein n=1 Tax=Methanocella sp. TaxID=2052833 RepID=UPI002B8A3CFD|nr:DUF473 domain-containing protein [Methanocella sp.]HTY90058.1 DUF473 domain-containing protein [Methanocella sp.]